MSKRNNSRWTGRLAIIALCVALTAAIIWGLSMALIKLMHYGENAVIDRENRPTQSEESGDGALSANSALPRNTYESECF